MSQWGVLAVRIAIHTLGARGDVQPYVALALCLKAADHETLIAALSQFEAFVSTLSGAEGFDTGNPQPRGLAVFPGFRVLFLFCAGAFAVAVVRFVVDDDDVLKG